VSGRERTTDDDRRFDVEPGDRTRWTEDPAEDQELDPESEPGRGAPYEQPAGPVDEAPEPSEG
jgi:hypothetical protein